MLNQNEMELKKEKVLAEAKSKYIAPILVDGRNCRVDTLMQYQGVELAMLKRLSFSSKYTEQLPVLPKFDSLEELSFFSGITIDQLKRIDLNGVKKLYATVLPSDEYRLSFESDTLEELCLSFRDVDDMVYVDFCGIPNLKHIEIRHAKAFCPSQIECLSQLESITMETDSFADNAWLRNLQSLRSFSLSGAVINDFDGILFPPSLKRLSLAFVEVNNVNNINRLCAMEYLNIFRTTGDIVRCYNDIRKLNIKRLIITEIDKYQDYFRDGVATNEAIWRTQSLIEKLKDEKSTLHPYTRKRYANQTEEEVYREKFFFCLRRSIDDAFYACNPKSYMFTEYDVSIKKWFVNKMEEVYPFFDFSEFYSQIAIEEKGFLGCVETSNADGFNFISDEGLFRVCFRKKGGKGLNVRMLSMRDFMDKKRNHSPMWHYADKDIKKTVSKYVPGYNFDAQAIEIVFLDYYGTAYKRKLEIAVVIAIALLHYGVRVENNIIFSGELNAKAEISRWPGPHRQLLTGVEIDRMVLFSTQKNVPSSIGPVLVNRYTDFKSFVEMIIEKGNCKCNCVDEEVFRNADE